VANNAPLPKQTGGTQFDPGEECIYFLASNPSRQQNGAVGQHRFLLVAANEISGDKDMEMIESWQEHGTKLFLDSGVFNLASEWARAKGITMDEALSTPPDQVEGFAELLDKYVRVVQRLEPMLWGYIEVDQGGRENKIRTRARLESMGLKPIPVYHPKNDGWEYFDELASSYDRICCGNVVKADTQTRKRLLATMWERRRRYPHLWIHMLGMTPNEWLNAYPVNSADSSTWLAPVRWPDSDSDRSMLKTIGKMPVDYAYVLGSDTEGPTGDRKAVAVSAYKASMNLRNWRNHVEAMRRLGCDPYASIQ
jgi:hypothetical protein